MYWALHSLGARLAFYLAMASAPRAEPLSLSEALAGPSGMTYMKVGSFSARPSHSCEKAGPPTVDRRTTEVAAGSKRRWSVPGGLSRVGRVSQVQRARDKDRVPDGSRTASWPLVHSGKNHPPPGAGAQMKRTLPPTLPDANHGSMATSQP